MTFNSVEWPWETLNGKHLNRRLGARTIRADLFLELTTHEESKLRSGATSSEIGRDMAPLMSAANAKTCVVQNCARDKGEGRRSGDASRGDIPQCSCLK